MEHYQIMIDPEPTDEDIRTIVSHVVGFDDRPAEHAYWQRLSLFVRNAAGQIIGGLNGYTHWDWLFISHVWVDDALRRQGYGRELIERAEEEALRRGCLHAHADTYSFQARGFYEALGYKIFGVLEDFPKGHTRYFFQRRNLHMARERARNGR